MTSGRAWRISTSGRVLHGTAAVSHTPSPVPVYVTCGGASGLLVRSCRPVA